MRIRDEMNRAYAEGMCQGLGHSVEERER